jgi:hypothetical protein
MDRGLPLFTEPPRRGLLGNPEVWLDNLMSRESDVIRDIRFLAEHMSRDCRDALWRAEHLSSKLEEGESLNTPSTAVQLAHACEELQRALEGIERLEKYCEQELGGQ